MRFADLDPMSSKKMLNRPSTDDGQRTEPSFGVAITETRIDLQCLLNWTDGFDPPASDILTILKEFRIVRLKSLTEFESSQAAALIEHGCMRASASGSLLEQVEAAENIFAGFNSLLNQGLVLAESTTESTLGNLLKVYNF